MAGKNPRMVGQRVKDARGLSRWEQDEEDYQGFVSEGHPHATYNYPTSPAGRDVIAEQDYKRKTTIEPFSWYKGNEGMLTNIGDKVKGFGKHLAENNPVSLRFKEVQAHVDAYDAYWLKRLQHPGAPLREDYGNEVDFDNDYDKYWTERPLEYDWFN